MLTLLYFTVFSNLIYAIPDVQINALIDIYNALDGSQWWWCKWNITQIKMGIVDDHCGLHVSNESVVTELYLRDMGMNGTIPNSIGDLSTLTIMECQAWNIARLFGTLPDSICNITRLEVLYILDTDITGTIPSCLFTDLYNLTSLVLSRNQFTGSIPPFTKSFANIIYLHIGEHFLNGSLPDTFHYLQRLQELNLDVDYINGTIPTSLCNISTLKYLGIGGDDLTFSPLRGTIPECLFASNRRIDTLWLEYLPLISGTIPDSIGNLEQLRQLTLTATGLNGTIPNEICNTHNLWQLIIHDTPVVGTIPDCFGNFTPLVNLRIYNTSFHGNVPSLCDNINLWYINIAGNNKLNGSIPGCDNYNLSVLSGFYIYDNPLLCGSIPYLYCGEALEEIEITNNPNTENNKLSSCIINSTKLRRVDISDGNFIGTLPSIIHFPKLNYLVVGNNKLDGSLSDILQINESSNLPRPLGIHMHHNNFEENDISRLLKLLFTTQRNLQFLSLAGNRGISGSIPEISSTDKATHVLSHFLIHSCNIHGTLPQTLFGHELEFITVFDNRLSCKIPSNFINTSTTSKLNSTMLLPGNLFQCNSDYSLPMWMISPFMTATNLYITPTTNAVSYMLFIISVGCILVVFFKMIVLRQKKLKHSNQIALIFTEDIELFQSKLVEWKLLILVTLLLILYPISSNYFSCSPVVSWFTLSFFVSNNEHNINSWNNWILLILTVSLHLIFCHIVFQLSVIQLSSNLNKKANDKHILLLDFNDPSKSVINEISTERNVSTNARSFIVLIIIFLSYLCAYLCSILLIMFYSLFASLPDDNTISIARTQLNRQFITRSIATYLTVNNALVVPNLYDSFVALLSHYCISCQNKLSQYRSQTIVLLRTLNTVILPIIFSIVLLDECGKYWTKYWYPCIADKQQFDVTVCAAGGCFDLLSSKDVCAPNHILIIDWNKCIRSTLYRWSHIILIKYIIMIVLPIWIVMFKTSKNWIQRKYYQCINDKERYKNITINIDSEYAMITTKLEAVFAFSIVCPLLIPVIIIAFESSKYFYRFMINNLKWKLTQDTNLQLSSFPAHLLFIGILSGQILTCSFLVFCIQNGTMSYLYISILCSVDMLYFGFYVKAKRRNNRAPTEFNLDSLIE